MVPKSRRTTWARRVWSRREILCMYIYIYIYIYLYIIVHICIIYNTYIYILYICTYFIYIYITYIWGFGKKPFDGFWRTCTNDVKINSTNKDGLDLCVWVSEQVAALLCLHTAYLLSRCVIHIPSNSTSCLVPDALFLFCILYFVS